MVGCSERNGINLLIFKHLTHIPLSLWRFTGVCQDSFCPGFEILLVNIADGFKPDILCVLHTAPGIDMSAPLSAYTTDSQSNAFISAGN